MTQPIGICVLGMRRTGSNHLFNVLRNFEDLASCGELFSDARVSGVAALLPRIRDITGLKCHSEEDPLLRAYAHGNPGAFIDIVAQAASRQRKQAYCFKIFEDQLDWHKIETDILARPQMHLVLLVRTALDAYVSLQKAALTQHWMSLDTTNVAVTLDAEAFAAWLVQKRTWYRHWLDWATRQGRPSIVLSYENDVDHPLPVVLGRFATTARKLGIKLTQPSIIQNPGLHRQDRNSTVESRVQNWPEFAAALKRLGLDKEAFRHPI